MMLKSLNALSLARDNETSNHIIRTQWYVKKVALKLLADGHYTKKLNGRTSGQSKRSNDIAENIFTLLSLRRSCPYKIRLERSPQHTLMQDQLTSGLLGLPMIGLEALILVSLICCARGPERLPHVFKLDHILNNMIEQMIIN